jgi:hypothetical protein
MPLLLFVTMLALLMSVSMFFAYKAATGGFQKLRTDSLNLGKEVFRLRFLSDELLTSTNFKEGYAAWAASLKSTDALLAAGVPTRAINLSLDNSSQDACRLDRRIPLLVTTLDAYLDGSLGKLSESVSSKADAADASLSFLVVILSISTATATGFLLFSFVRAFGGSLASFEKAIATWNGVDFSMKVAAGIAGEIEAGSRDTGAAMQHLRDLRWKIAESVKELHGSVSAYKTRETGR